MLSSLLILTVLVMGGQDASKQNIPRRATSDNQTQQAQPVGPPAVAIVNPTVSAPPSQQQPTQQESQPYWYFHPEWMIVWLTLLYTFTSWLTLRAIQRQAKTMDTQAKEVQTSAAEASRLAQATLAAIERQGLSMRRQTTIFRDSVAVAMQSAEAAKATLSAMRDIERAWLIEEVGFPESLPREYLLGGGIWTARVTIKNIGKQPAVLQAIRTRFHTSKILAPNPELKDAQLFYGQIVAPGEELHIRVILEEGSLNDETVNHLEKATYGPWLYIYGIITYTSVGVGRENRFRYKWDNCMGFSFVGDKPRFEKNGPAEYNSHT